MSGGCDAMVIGGGSPACFEGAMALAARKRKIALPADTAIFTS